MSNFESGIRIDSTIHRLRTAKPEGVSCKTDRLMWPVGPFGVLLELSPSSPLHSLAVNRRALGGKNG